MSKKFGGFESPKQNWSKLPHQIVDALDQIKTISEMKVIIYTLRHTWGYQDDYKKITIDEFRNGRKHKDGTRIDNGTGLSKPAIIGGIKKAIEHGFLFEYTDRSDAARVKKFYSLTESGLKVFTPDVKSFNTGGKESVPRSEKDTSDRQINRKKLKSPNGEKSPKTSTSQENIPNQQTPQEENTPFGQKELEDTPNDQVDLTSSSIVDSWLEDGDICTVCGNHKTEPGLFECMSQHTYYDSVAEGFCREYVSPIVDDDQDIYFGDMGDDYNPPLDSQPDTDLNQKENVMLDKLNKPFKAGELGAVIARPSTVGVGKSDFENALIIQAKIDQFEDDRKNGICHLCKGPLSEPGPPRCRNEHRDYMAKHKIAQNDNGTIQGDSQAPPLEDELFNNRETRTSKTPSLASMSDKEKSEYLILGKLPGQQVNPQWNTIQEIQNSGWQINDFQVLQAIAYYVEAVRTKFPDFQIPNNKGRRNDWYKSVKGHLDDYELKDLEELYTAAVDKLASAKMSFSRPGSLDKTLPDIAMELSMSVGGVVASY